MKNLFVFACILFFGSCSPKQLISTNIPSEQSSIYAPYEPKQDLSYIKTAYIDRRYTKDQVDEVARFPGCGDNYSVASVNCGERKLLKMLYENLTYPARARDLGIQGTVDVDVVITPAGKMTAAIVNDSPSTDLTRASLDVLALINKKTSWLPATKDGQAVAMNYSIPINFKLH